MNLGGQTAGLGLGGTTGISSLPLATGLEGMLVGLGGGGGGADNCGVDD